MSSLRLEIKQQVAFIFLSREDKLNSFNREMSLALQQAMKNCGDDDSVRAICITGTGKAFSAGQDLAEVSDPQGPLIQQILSEQLNPLISIITSLQKPVIAAVNGVAAGAGANIALCCDVVVATESASFIQAFSKIGLIPDSGGTFILPRLVGWQKASALMMLGEKVSAREAERMGMIYKVFADDKFEEEYTSIAYLLAQLPTRALALTKEALRRSYHNTLEQQLKCEDELQSIAGTTVDYAEGIKSFLEKRKPQFRGL